MHTLSFESRGLGHLWQMIVPALQGSALCLSTCGSCSISENLASMVQDGMTSQMCQLSFINGIICDGLYYRYNGSAFMRIYQNATGRYTKLTVQSQFHDPPVVRQTAALPRHGRTRFKVSWLSKTSEHYPRCMHMARPPDYSSLMAPFLGCALPSPFYAWRREPSGRFPKQQQRGRIILP